ncbi:MAG: hypothetical protein OXN17_14450 [Candidatus Poribacteria bacterium]|nr:hypothetical protein [Candidatus Poribacteria bacterium]MDE0504889.1 hypothetical protein [Candidatus Poribacteria bacterium]
MSHLDTTLKRFVELSGDRTGDLGESIKTGFGWVDRHKLVLIADSGAARNHGPGSWRRASRVIGVARHLGKPLLLWNLSFHHSTVDMKDVGAQDAIQKSERDLIEFPAPILSVIEGTTLGAFSAVELAVPDGTVFVDGAEALCEYLSVSPRTTHAGDSAEIAAGISELLTEIVSISVRELIAQRTARLASIAMG